VFNLELDSETVQFLTDFGSGDLSEGVRLASELLQLQNSP